MKEYEIRPKEIFDEYLKISKHDSDRFFSDHRAFVEMPCPACKSNDTHFSFKKNSFSYRICNDCATLFVSPRPTEAMINNYYRKSASSKFWAERFFPETAEARRIKIFRPRAQLVSKLISNLKMQKPIVLADVGSGFGIFLQEAQTTGTFDEVVGIEPSVDLARCCREKEFRVIEKPIEKIRGNELQASVVCSFEVLEHLFDPEKFIKGMKRILKPCGIMIFTTLSISGLDLQVLWKNSKSISPPHHLNFLSVEGLKEIIKRCGLEEIDICTPGKLDLDIIRNTMQEMPKLPVPRFIEYVIKQRGQKTLEQFQEFLQANNLSSHARVVARKQTCKN